MRRRHIQCSKIVHQRGYVILPDQYSGTMNRPNSFAIMVFIAYRRRSQNRIVGIGTINANDLKPVSYPHRIIRNCQRIASAWIGSRLAASGKYRTKELRK